MRETVAVFGRAGSLVGIITDPPSNGFENAPAVIILNAGIVHRVGPNRLFVKLARQLAGLGLVVFRFDASGIGDSRQRGDHLPFDKSAVLETQDAMEFLGKTRAASQFILIGLCSGARVSFAVAASDRRVVGAVLIDVVLTPLHEFSDELNAYSTESRIARSYWRVKLFHPQSWKRMIAGKADYVRILKTLAFQLRNAFVPKPQIPGPPDHVVASLRDLVDRGVRLLFIFPQEGRPFEYFQMTLGAELRCLASSSNVNIKTIPHTDHTFTLIRHQDELRAVIEDWIHVLMRDQRMAAQLSMPAILLAERTPAE